MVIFVREQNNYDPAEDDEFIYIKRDEKKVKEAEMEMLTPILLDSMFECSPPEIHRIIKHAKHVMDHPDDATAVTTETLSDLYLPSLDTPPRARSTASYNDDDSSDLSLDSDDFRVHLSPRSTLSHGNVSNNFHLIIPADVKFQGDVIFSNSSSPQEINLKPRPSSNVNSVFKLRRNFGNEAFYRAHTLADSISYESYVSYDTYNQGLNKDEGAEECKDDSDSCSKESYEEGFVYVMGSRTKEVDYWGRYGGHYGSRDFEENSNQADYAVDHESVQDDVEKPIVLSPKYQARSPPVEEPRSFLEEVQDLFASCFTCGV